MQKTKQEQLRRLGDISQIAGIRHSILDDGKGRGMRILDVKNYGGIDFTVYPDKGLDIGPASFAGIPLAWTSPNGPVAPAFYSQTGFEWLRTWSGGLLTSCGLLNVGGPCETEQGPQGLHGRAHHTPASEVSTRCQWRDDGSYSMEISGTISHTRVFGEKLTVRRTIRTILGIPEVELTDATENEGSTTLPLMQLYHMNFGWPLLEKRSTLEIAKHKIVPQNSYCRENLDDWYRFTNPIPNFREQVFYHDIPAEQDGYCRATLKNPKLALAATVAFRKEELPLLIQWKMTGEREYVCGLEPSNCHPEGLPANKERGLLRYIEPGQTVVTRIKFSVSKMQ